MSDIEDVVALDDDDDEDDESREPSDLDEEEDGSGIEEENFEESTENERSASDDDSDDLEIQEEVCDASSSPDRKCAVTDKPETVIATKKDSIEIFKPGKVASPPNLFDEMEVDEVEPPAKDMEKLIPHINTSTPSGPKERSLTTTHSSNIDLPPSQPVDNIGPKNILQTAKFDIRVSSVLNKATKQHGKMFMLDGKEETHWSSDQGTTQFVSFFFQVPQKMSNFKIQFQGGFAAQSIRLIIETDDPQTGFSETFYPKDSLQIQHFTLKRAVDSMVSALFIFEESSDFFGRIVVYKLEIFE